MLNPDANLLTPKLLHARDRLAKVYPFLALPLMALRPVMWDVPGLTIQAAPERNVLQYQPDFVVKCSIHELMFALGAAAIKSILALDLYTPALGDDWSLAKDHVASCMLVAENVGRRPDDWPFERRFVGLSVREVHRILNNGQGVQARPGQVHVEQRTVTPREATDMLMGRLEQARQHAFYDPTARMVVLASGERVTVSAYQRQQVMSDAMKDAMKVGVTEPKPVGALPDVDAILDGSLTKLDVPLDHSDTHALVVQLCTVIMARYDAAPKSEGAERRLWRTEWHAAINNYAGFLLENFERPSNTLEFAEALLSSAVRFDRAQVPNWDALRTRPAASPADA